MSITPITSTCVPRRILLGIEIGQIRSDGMSYHELQFFFLLFVVCDWPVVMHVV